MIQLWILLNQFYRHCILSPFIHMAHLNLLYTHIETIPSFTTLIAKMSNIVFFSLTRFLSPLFFFDKNQSNLSARRFNHTCHMLMGIFVMPTYLHIAIHEIFSRALLRRWILMVHKAIIYRKMLLLMLLLVL